MSILGCDRKGCKRLAFGEVYMPNVGDDGESVWYFACWWHYFIERIRRIFGKTDFGFCRIDTTREAIEHIRMDLWELQGDILEIKQHFGIVKEDDKENIDVT